MKSSLLPEPLDFSNCTTSEEQEKIAYDYFCKNIKDNNFLLEGVKIKIKDTLACLGGKEAIFEHLCGFDKDNYEIEPCLNMTLKLECKLECRAEYIPANQRNLCLYRARTLPWFTTIMSLVGNCEFIKVWDAYDIRQRREKTKIRFTHEIADYIIVLNKVKKGTSLSYELITAYPMFKKGDRRKADAEYREYIKSKK